MVVWCSLFIPTTFGRLIAFLMGQQDNEPPPPPPPPQPPEDNHSSSTTTTPKTQTSTCEICIEPMQLSVEKFRFLIHCDHPFCSECMIKYICAKLDDNIGKIPCPALDCNRFLDPLTCQPLIDPKVFVRWGDVLCESSVMELERSYCPNRNCSALIVNECGGRRSGKKVTCPNCKRPFCFRCMLPWHGVLGCDESQEFRESGDIEFGILAKNRGWIRCPRCRHFVQRVNGCRIIKCRLTAFLMGQQDNEPPPPPPPQPPENNHSSSTTTNPKTQTSTCEICIEPMQLPVEKFRFLIHCDHPFCSDCMIKYICAKLDDNIGKIPCPTLDCNQFLDPLTCQPLIDPKVFVRWCDVLCESTVMELERSYCPNRNCSALIVNECGGRRRGKKATCPNCKTPFCFRCMLPWHGVLGCDESREFRESCDLEFGILAKNKGWIRCPRCRHFVERVNGCRIINCRCRAQFCYVCGVEVSRHWCKCQGFNRMLCFSVCMALVFFVFLFAVVMYLVHVDMGVKN